MAGGIFGLILLGLSLDFIKARRTRPPAGPLTPEEIRDQPALLNEQVVCEQVAPAEWQVVRLRFQVTAREAIAVREMEIRTKSGRVLERVAATPFAASADDGGFRPEEGGEVALISFPVIGRAVRGAGISAQFSPEEKADGEIFGRISYFKLGPAPALLRLDPSTGLYREGGPLAADGLPRNEATGLFAQALPAVEFRERHAGNPFTGEYGYWTRILAAGFHPLSAARASAGIPEGPAIWMRGESAWLLEDGTGGSRLVAPNRNVALPGRLVRLAEALREREMTLGYPRAERATVPVPHPSGGATGFRTSHFVSTVRRLAEEGLVIDGLEFRPR